VLVACNVPTKFIRAMSAIQTVASVLFTCDIIEATTLACSVRSPLQRMQVLLQRGRDVPNHRRFAPDPLRCERALH
jgi:hypothetical protein